MLDTHFALTIVLMATVTYLTRLGGYVFLRNRTFSLRLTAVLEGAPGCVLITIIAPHFVSERPADLVALAITLIAATRLPMLPTVIIAMASAAILRGALP